MKKIKLLFLSTLIGLSINAQSKQDTTMVFLYVSSKVPTNQSNPVYSVVGYEVKVYDRRRKKYTVKYLDPNKQPFGEDLLIFKP